MMDQTTRREEQPRHDRAMEQVDLDTISRSIQLAKAPRMAPPEPFRIAQLTTRLRAHLSLLLTIDLGEPDRHLHSARRIALRLLKYGDERRGPSDRIQDWAYCKQLAISTQTLMRRYIELYQPGYRPPVTWTARGSRPDKSDWYVVDDLGNLAPIRLAPDSPPTEAIGLSKDVAEELAARLNHTH